ncbi:MAG: hypothetical protein GY696_01245, partial [Gammaproteobacteria bacterium]|nr:hypothetical protein [Gammaproteobacteria bacterium]
MATENDTGPTGIDEGDTSTEAMDCLDDQALMAMLEQSRITDQERKQFRSKLLEAFVKPPKIEYIDTLGQLDAMITILNQEWQPNSERALGINVMLVDKWREAETFNLSLKLTWDLLVNYRSLTQYGVDEDYVALVCLAIPPFSLNQDGNKEQTDTVVVLIDMLRITKRVSIMTDLQPYKEVFRRFEEMLNSFHMVGYRQRHPLCLLLQHYNVEIRDEQYREITEVYATVTGMKADSKWETMMINLNLTTADDDLGFSPPYTSCHLFDLRMKEDESTSMALLASQLLRKPETHIPMHQLVMLLWYLPLTGSVPEAMKKVATADLVSRLTRYHVNLGTQRPRYDATGQDWGKDQRMIECRNRIAYLRKVSEEREKKQEDAGEPEPYIEYDDDPKAYQEFCNVGMWSKHFNTVEELPIQEARDKFSAQIKADKIWCLSVKGRQQKCDGGIRVSLRTRG